ncbi:MAG: ABC transporter ATP-binding protein [bacterium]|nr:ABC transporter ATP-binding protein [bacterium]
MIEIEGLTVQYGARVALDDVSFSVKGPAVGLLGPNGAGKTTLIRGLLGFLKPARGRGTVLGNSIVAERLKVRQLVGYLPEDDCLIPDMSAVRFLTYFGELCGMPKTDATQRAHEVLHYVGLGEARYRNVETFSAGMKQRIKLAQALIHDPKLLLLDEPTNGMDPAGREEMLRLIGDISREKGIGVLVSTHLLPDVEAVCDEVVVLNKGTVAVHGKIAELQGENRKVYEVRVQGNRNRFCEILVRHGYEWKEWKDNMIKVLVPENEGTAKIFAAAKESDNQIRHLVFEKSSLEQVFVESVKDRKE